MPTDFPDEFLETIGSITIWLVWLERQLTWTISSSIEVDLNLLNRLISTESFDTLLSIFKKSLIYYLNFKDIKDAAIKDEIFKIHRNLTEINDTRNKIMHSLWMTDKDGNIKRHKFKKSIKTNPDINEHEVMTLESLKTFLEKIKFNMVALGDLQEKIILLLSP